MKKFDSRTYSVTDFLEWNQNELLKLSPDFQRRSVWTDKAKSYLIDTVLEGKLMPKVIIQQKLIGKRTVRIVVDGQQRLRAILDFYENQFKISKAHNKVLADCTFSTLPKQRQDDFLKYEIGVDLLYDIPYPDLLDIFSRLNSYTVKLNNQELFNAQYLGFFKQEVYKLGYKYVQYYIDSSIISTSQVTRMAEAELTADLFVSILDGIQTNKKIETFYKQYEDSAANLEEIAKKFDKIMSYIGAIYKPDELKNNNFSRIHLFYSLFNSVAHLLFGIVGIDKKYRATINEKSVPKIRIALDSISAEYDEVLKDRDMEGRSKEFREFINYTRRGTTDTAARRSRATYICKRILKAL